MTLKRKNGRAHRGRRVTDAPQPADITTPPVEVEVLTADSSTTDATPDTPPRPVTTPAAAITAPRPAATVAEAAPPAATATATKQETTRTRPTPTGPARANGANASGRFAVSWQDEELDTLRAVYEYAYQHPDFAPDVSTSISDYLADVLTAWVNVPARRRTTLMTGVLANQRAGGNQPRTYAMPDDVFIAVDRARDQDARLQNRFVGRSAFARAALAHARISAEAHNGHKPLPVPPERGRRGPRTDPRPAM